MAHMVGRVITFTSSVHGTSQNLHVFLGFDRMEWWRSARVSLLKSASQSLIAKDCVANYCTWRVRYSPALTPEVHTELWETKKPAPWLWHWVPTWWLLGSSNWNLSTLRHFSDAFWELMQFMPKSPRFASSSICRCMLRILRSWHTDTTGIYIYIMYIYDIINALWTYSVYVLGLLVSRISSHLPKSKQIPFRSCHVVSQMPSLTRHWTNIQQP